MCLKILYAFFVVGVRGGDGAVLRLSRRMVSCMQFLGRAVLGFRCDGAFCGCALVSSRTSLMAARASAEAFFGARFRLEASILGRSQAK